MGGGDIAPPAVNRPFSVEKLRIFKNERSENAPMGGAMSPQIGAELLNRAVDSSGDDRAGDRYKEF